MTQKSKSPDEATHINTAQATLYVVATPIGNLGDMTFRAVETLKRVSVIACEDTRVSRKLCTHYGIETTLVPYHDHNAQKALPPLLQRLEQGKHVALISDAGTPLISDPGYRLVKEVAAMGIKIVPIPGASSMITAASVAGLPTDTLHYAGFLPNKQQARRLALQALACIKATIICFESNHRIIDTLKDMCDILGAKREVVIARELTKSYEEIRRGSCEVLAQYYGGQAQVKGEIVILIAPPEEEVVESSQAVPLLKALLPHYPARQVASLVADTMGLRANALYQQILQLKQEENI